MHEANNEPGVIDYFTAALFFSPQGRPDCPQAAERAGRT